MDFQGLLSQISELEAANVEETRKLIEESARHKVALYSLQGIYSYLVCRRPAKNFSEVSLHYCCPSTFILMLYCAVQSTLEKVVTKSAAYEECIAKLETEHTANRKVIEQLKDTVKNAKQEIVLLQQHNAEEKENMKKQRYLFTLFRGVN